MFIKPENLDELLKIITENNVKKFFLAGGTDLNVLIKKGIINDDNIIYINHLTELKKIYKENNEIIIGALSTYDTIINSKELNLPFLQNSLKTFASPIIQTMATIGGNIANGSPTNDVSPLLLVLDAKLILISKNGEREVFLKDFYTGYKKNILRNDEIIGYIKVPELVEKDYITYYKKVASRDILAISKLSLAGLKTVNENVITRIKLAVGALNEYPKRLFELENYLINKSLHQLDFSKIREILHNEITPISDFRSDKEYRFEVCQNLITEFLSQK